MDDIHQNSKKRIILKCINCIKNANLYHKYNYAVGF